MDDIIYYQSYYGFIRGYFLENRYFHCSQFYIYGKYRGQNYGNELGKHLPQKCQLVPNVIYGISNEDDFYPCLNYYDLIKFYEKLGFIQSQNFQFETYMIRH